MLPSWSPSVKSLMDNLAGRGEVKGVKHVKEILAHAKGVLVSRVCAHKNPKFPLPLDLQQHRRRHRHLLHHCQRRRRHCRRQHRCKGQKKTIFFIKVLAISDNSDFSMF
jgi:hypothetical protein